MAWLFVPELEGLSLGSESSGPDFAPWLSLSGKVTQRPLSWRGWASRPWIKLLSGTISAPSTASRGVAKWIASLAESHVSRSALPGSVEDSQMSGGLATISSGWSMRFDPESSCWKTSQVSLFTDSQASSEDWKILSRAGGVQNGCAYPRQPWVPLTGVNASSDFSWPTPTAAAQGGRFDHSRKGLGGRDLKSEAENWPTPTSQDAGGSGSAGYSTASGRHGGVTLTDATVRASRLGLPTQTAEQKWPTPTSRDWKDTITGGPPPSRLKLSEQTLGQSVSVMTGPQGLPTVTGGESGSTQEGRRQRLNPAFVEALMGLPPGWSLPMTGSGASETQLWLSSQRRRLASLLGV